MLGYIPVEIINNDKFVILKCSIESVKLAEPILNLLSEKSTYYLLSDNYIDNKYSKYLVRKINTCTKIRIQNKDLVGILFL